MKFSLSLLPDVTPARAAEIARAAESNGIHGFWVADEIYHRDPWMTLAACALNTKRIRLGTGVTHVVLREPTFVAQALGTLDQMAPSRTFCGISIGNIGMLAQYLHLPPAKELKPFLRLEESLQIIRTLMRDGKVDYKGKFHQYSSITSSATTKNQVPFYLGGMGGPKSFQLAGKIGDGIMTAMGYSKEYHQYVVRNAAEGAAEAGRSQPKKLPYAAWDIFCTAPNSDAAREAARSFVAFYIPAMPDQQVKLHGVSAEAVKPIRDAFAKADFDLAVKLTTDEFVEKFSISGSPSEVVEKLERNFIQGGVDELVACIVEPEVVGSMMGVRIKDVPGYPANLELISKEVIPHLS